MYLYLPIVLQGMAMVIDEFYFHHKRGLPQWEKIGHPIDTLSVLACYLFIYLMPMTDNNLNIYIGLCAFSCLLVTKDEFVHTSLCTSGENWLHSILFILHPITFLCAGLIWQKNSDQTFLMLQVIIISIFLMYQIIYWSAFAKKQR